VKLGMEIQEPHYNNEINKVLMQNIDVFRRSRKQKTQEISLHLSEREDASLPDSAEQSDDERFQIEPVVSFEESTEPQDVQCHLTAKAEVGNDHVRLSSVAMMNGA